MFPSSANTHLALLYIKNIKDEIGVNKNVVISSKNISGSARSITQSEYQASASLGIKFDLKVVIQAFLYDGSKYAKIKDQIYKIERTYLNGQFLELYLVSSDIEVEFDA